MPHIYLTGTSHGHGDDRSVAKAKAEVAFIALLCKNQQSVLVPFDHDHELFNHFSIIFVATVKASFTTEVMDQNTD